MRKLTKEEREAICIALICRKNYIETGSVELSAKSAEKTNRKDEIKALSTDQMKLLVLSDELIAKSIQGKIFTED